MWAALLSLSLYPLIKQGLRAVLESAALTTTSPVETVAMALAAFVSLVVLTAFVRLARNADRSETVWRPPSSDQYLGQHAESGGIARIEQEEALRDIQDDES